MTSGRIGTLPLFIVATCKHSKQLTCFSQNDVLILLSFISCQINQSFITTIRVRPDSSPVVFIKQTAARKVAEKGMMGRQKGRRLSLLSFPPSHHPLLHLSHSVDSRSLQRPTDHWGRVRSSTVSPVCLPIFLSRLGYIAGRKMAS